MRLWRQKIPAGALQFAILISVVIAVIISAFILLSYTQQQFAKQIKYSAKSLKLSNSGIDFLKQKDITYGDSISFNPESSERESFVLYKTHWGIYDKVVSIGQSKNFTTKKIAIVGGKTSKEDRLALYLEETNSPLVLVGKTVINGDVVLPSQGAKPGAIAGDYFQGSQLIDGTLRDSRTSKPSVSTLKLDYIRDLLFGDIPNQDSLFIQSIESVTSSSFSTDPKWLYRPGIIEIGEQEIKNNIIVKSDTLIRVSAFAKAENIILVAPHIEIVSNVNGTFQAFASKSIRLGEQVRLKYPSSLVLMQDEQESKEEKEKSDGIILGSQSVVSGSVLHLSSANDTYQKAMIHLAESSLVRGEVYSDQTIELLGKVEGSVYTHQFEVNAKGSVYKNHLFNTTVKSKNFPEVFCGLQTDITEVNIAQWVY
jgi:hypothetical protein